MAFIPHTEADVAAMLAAIGVSRIEDLFDEIPQELRIGSLAGVPETLNEMEIGRLMSERARSDGTALCFIGAGAYEHHIPAAVWAITTRGEFYSAYTPYQAEISQGTLQSIFEFQTMISELTGMDLANASMYDGSTAAAEAAMMAVRLTGRRSVIVARSLHPEYREVLATYATHQGMPLSLTGFGDDGRLALERKRARLQFALHRLESRAIGVGGAQRLAARQQEIAGKTVLDANNVAHLAQSGDALQEDHFHLGFLHDSGSANHASGSHRATARESGRV